MENRTKNNLIITLFIAIAFAVSWYALGRSFPELKSIIQEYMKTKAEISTIEQKVSNFHALEKSYGEYKENLDKMEKLVSDNLFIDREIPLSFTQSLEQWAENLGLEIEISPTKIQKTDRDFREFVGYKIRLRSKKLTPLLQFLRKLETSQWIINVSTVSLSLEQTKEKETYIVEDIFIKVYVF